MAELIAFVQDNESVTKLADSNLWQDFFVIFTPKKELYAVFIDPLGVDVDSLPPDIQSSSSQRSTAWKGTYWILSVPRCKPVSEWAAS